MSAGLSLTLNQSNPDTTQNSLITPVASETNPPAMESSAIDDPTEGVNHVEPCSSTQANCENADSSNQEKPDPDCSGENAEQKNDSSTFSTAFTISFDDDTTAAKKFGVRDSIRKFAPPKPHTIEKPRQPKSDQCQDQSLTSIESAPAEITKRSHRKGCSNSSRSSSRKSTSSRHSNVSESAAFLIDRMLNFKQSNGEEETSQESTNLSNKNKKSTKTPPSKGSQPNRMARKGADILDSEIDFCEDKSDNGTYIVGADPESDAARKKIDELFGVVKAASASVIAEREARNQREIDTRTSTRPSRGAEKKPTGAGERSGTTGNQIPRRNNSFVSRSSSSSRHETVSTERPRASSRHSRNSSCDRASKIHQTSRPRRSISQSSRQSSNKEASDGDTMSSRSSLRNDFEANNQAASLPSMKFNRAFALRRARLGLGEPTRIATSQSSAQENETVNNLSSSSRRHQVNANTYRQSQTQSSSGSPSFSRDDGGRFSLRMKNNALPNRLNSSAHASNRSSQHHTLLDNYISKVSMSKYGGLPSVNVISQQESQRSLAKYNNLSYAASSSLPYQSGDEQEQISPARQKLLANQTGRLQRKPTAEQESDTDSYNRFNYSLGTDYESNQQSFNETRACSSAGKRGSMLQLGALDSLVISAISSLSLKIRHSVCDVLVEQAKKLPVENETRLIVEEIFPQLTANSSESKSPTSIEEIDQSLYFDLAKTLKNLKKVEQMVDVINLISNQLPASPTSYNHSQSSNSNFKSTAQATGTVRASDSTNTSEINSNNDLSPV